MLNVDSNDNGEKRSTLTSKKTSLHVQHTFFVHFFAIAVAMWNFPHGENVACAHKKFCACVPVCFFFSLPLILSPCWLLTFSFSHGRHKIFMLFFQWNSSPLFFLSCCSSLLLFFSMSFTISPVTRQKSPLSDLIWYGTKVNLLWLSRLLGCFAA